MGAEAMLIYNYLRNLNSGMSQGAFFRPIVLLATVKLSSICWCNTALIQQVAVMRLAMKQPMALVACLKQIAFC